MGSHCSKSRKRPAAMASPPAAPRPNGAAESPFFQRLPAELRRSILIAAFGGRTIHPQQPACVCRSIHLKYSTANPAADDWCRARMEADDELKDEKWAIGVMGWLRCCRQAYAEGVDVFYATNTFHVWTVDLERNPLVDHFPARYLPLITSMEWVIDPYPAWVRTEPERSHKMVEVVRTLPIAALPNLARLYIGFRPMVWKCFRAGASPAQKYQAYTERILDPLDMLVSAGIADGLRDMEVAVPMSVFHPHLKMGISRGNKLDVRVAGWREGSERGTYGGWGPRQRIWRPVDREHGTRGYWLSESHMDMAESFLDDVPPYYWM